MIVQADQERTLRLLDGKEDSEELTLRQAALILPYSYPSCLRFHKAGHLRAIKKGGRYIVLVSEIRRFVVYGNYDPSASEPLPPSEAEKAAEVLPIVTNPKDGSVSLTYLTQEQRDRLGSIPPDAEITND